jgi:nitrate reductase NapD
MNVSGIVVSTNPDDLPEVIEKINSINLCEVHFYNSEGKIVATIEGESIHEQMECLKQIQSIPLVLNANLTYSYCEDELSGARSQINGNFLHISGSEKS